MRRRLLETVTAVTLSLSLLVGCGVSSTSSESAENASAAQFEEEGGYTILKGITDLTPHSEIIEYAEPLLEEKGIKVELVSTAADSTTNEKLAAGEIDFNFFQHWPYLQEQNEANGWDLVNAGNIHVEPITAYSEKYNSVEEIPDGAVVAIPNDGTNEYRALLILEQNGFITLNDETANALSATVNDIESYEKDIEIVELDSAQIIPTRADYDFFITNTNKYLESGIEANLLFQEDQDSPYANIIAVRSDEKDAEAIKTLVEVLQSEDVQNWIQDNYNGAVIPAVQ
ncbi:MAG: metal ABC transporter substrate-binding protein [Lachnospiraceae bacterium]|nr:metal ABC transporter substrate-binding protein [Lachnospiraceae bacterium]